MAPKKEFLEVGNHYYEGHVISYHSGVIVSASVSNQCHPEKVSHLYFKILCQEKVKSPFYQAEFKDKL